MNGRRQIGASRRWVIKIGSALLTDDGRGLHHDKIREWVQELAALRARGVELVLVSRAPWPRG